MLDYIRLNWERNGKDNEVCVEGKVIVLCPTYKVRGRVHIVSENGLVHLLHDPLPYKAALEKHESQFVEWRTDLLYVNHFFGHEYVHFQVCT